MDTCVAPRQESAHFTVSALVGMYTWILVQKLPKSGTSIMDDHTEEYMVCTSTVHPLKIYHRSRPDQQIIPQQEVIITGKGDRHMHGQGKTTNFDGDPSKHP